MARLLLVLAFVAAALAVYSVPENLLPPWGAAPHERWPHGPFPAGVASKQDAIMVLFLVAGILATVLAAVLAVQWERALPAAPGLIWVAAYALVQSLALTWSAAFATRGALAHLVASR